MNKPLVYVVGTGGTIASKYDSTLGGHISSVPVQDLAATVPELADVAVVRMKEHSNVNSALMDTRTAFALRDTLRKVLQDESVAGVVVTHGTATLEETAYLMDLTLGSDKPVVFTGAQRNFDEKDPDGPRNLLYAVMIAAHPDARGRGVLVALAGEIYSAREATKINPESVACFGARDGGAAGMVTKQSVTFFSVPGRRVYLDVDHVKENVHVIKMVQGSNDLLLRACISGRVDGIVMEGRTSLASVDQELGDRVDRHVANPRNRPHRRPLAEH